MITKAFRFRLSSGISSRPILCISTALALTASIQADPPRESAQRPPRQPDWSQVPKPGTSQKKVAQPAPTLPPLPDGVEELKFADFFKRPVGPFGLEITPELKSLDGKRVRILGFQVHEDLSRCNSGCANQTRNGRPIPAWMEATVAGRMMLTPNPTGVSHAHYGLADDLPPQTVFVTVPTKFGQPVPFTPGPLLLTGVLSVGNKREPDGRISVVRLLLDMPDSPAPHLSSTHTTEPKNP